MGTYWTVKIPDAKQKKKIKFLIQNTLKKDEEMLSSWKKHSIVSQFNQSKKNILQPIDKTFFHIISTILKINKKTEGKLDITVSPLINMWGFGINKKPNNYPSKDKIKKKLSIVGSQHLHIITNFHGIYLQKDMNDVTINLSTVAEGFAIDHLSYILNKEGIEDYTISIGGAILVKNKNKKAKPKIIAIQTPIDTQRSIHLLINLKNNAISTAGSYRNYYYLNGIRLSHLIDPFTGIPVQHNLVSVSVIATSALDADSWDTGLLILGFEKAKKLALKEKLSVCLITQKKEIFSTWASPEFKKFLVKK